MPKQPDIGERWVHQPATETAEILREFQEEAPQYEKNLRDWGYQLPQDSTAILKQFVRQNAKILEAGCGTGVADQAHYDAGYTNLYGCDLTQAMLDRAAEKQIHRCLLRTDLEKPLPFPDNEFDCVTCLATLTYIKDAEPTLREFCRVTKSGGYILFSQRNDLFRERNQKALLDKLQQEGLWERAHLSGWLPYLPKHEAYIENQIEVGYFLYCVR